MESPHLSKDIQCVPLLVLMTAFRDHASQACLSSDIGPHYGFYTKCQRHPWSWGLQNIKFNYDYFIGYTCVRLYHVSPCLTMYIILCGLLIILPSLNLSLRGTLKIPLNGIFLSLYVIFSCVHCISSVSHRHLFT